MNRAIVVFVTFVLAMHDYLMHGRIVENDTHITPFQRMIVRELYDPRDICDYVRLFEFYCQWLHLWIGLSMKPMEILGLEKFVKLIGIEIPKKEKKEEVKEASTTQIFYSIFTLYSSPFLGIGSISTVPKPIDLDFPIPRYLANANSLESLSNTFLSFIAMSNRAHPTNPLGFLFLS